MVMLVGDLVREAQPGKPFVVDLRIAVCRTHADVAADHLLRPERGARRAERPRGELDDPLDDGVHPLGARQLTAELEQRGGPLRLAARRLVEARVLERDGGVAGEQLEQADVVLVELVETELRDHDDADDPRAERERDDDL